MLTSSTMTCEVEARWLSDASRRKRMPVVQNSSFVSRVYASSSRTWYPTSLPRVPAAKETSFHRALCQSAPGVSQTAGAPGGETPRSWHTRSATLMAAIRRGCVQMMLHSPPRPSSMLASSRY